MLSFTRLHKFTSSVERQSVLEAEMTGIGEVYASSHGHGKAYHSTIILHRAPAALEIFPVQLRFTRLESTIRTV